jgi:hypothetical protein
MWVCHAETYTATVANIHDYKTGKFAATINVTNSKGKVVETYSRTYEDSDESRFKLKKEIYAEMQKYAPPTNTTSSIAPVSNITKGEVLGEKTTAAQIEE